MGFSLPRPGRTFHTKKCAKQYENDKTHLKKDINLQKIIEQSGTRTHASLRLLKGQFLTCKENLMEV